MAGDLTSPKGTLAQAVKASEQREAEADRIERILKAEEKAMGGLPPMTAEERIQADQAVARAVADYERGKKANNTP